MSNRFITVGLSIYISDRNNFFRGSAVLTTAFITTLKGFNRIHLKNMAYI